MHPEFVSFDLFGNNITIHFYGLMIAIGAFLGYLFMAHHAKKRLGIDTEIIQGLCIWIIFSAFVGGKFLFYLEKPGFYFNPPSNMLHNFRTGFVFYGSLLFAIPTAIWYFRKYKLPLLPMLDLLAITACIIHICGRMGCFFAGCCYGLPTDKPWGITFTDEISKAPLNQSLHPTQLYEVFLIGTIMIILLMFKRYQRFKGQLFFIYVMLYAVGRSINEIFRGDIRRGFIIDDVLSHSQFISLILIAVMLFFYVRVQKKSFGT